MLVRSGALSLVVIDSVAALVPRAEIEGEMGDTHVGPAGPADVPGDAQAVRLAVEVRHHRDLHQPAPREDRRDVRLARDHPRWPSAQVLLLGPAGRAQDREPQGRHRRRRLAHAGQGGEEQGGPAVPSVRVRHHVRQGHLQGGLAASTSASTSRSSRSPAPGSPTRASSSARARRTPARSSPSTPTSRDEIERKVRAGGRADRVRRGRRPADRDRARSGRARAEPPVKAGKKGE